MLNLHPIIIHKTVPPSNPHFWYASISATIVRLLNPQCFFLVHIGCIFMCAVISNLFPFKVLHNYQYIHVLYIYISNLMLHTNDTNLLFYNHKRSFFRSFSLFILAREPIYLLNYYHLHKQNGCRDKNKNSGSKRNDRFSFNLQM